MGKVCFIYGLYGVDVILCLEDIKKFFDNYLKEVVILDFNYLYEMGIEYYLFLFYIIIEIFGSKLCFYLNMECLIFEMMLGSEL